MPVEIGQRIGDYEVNSLLGAGGMGQVYRVTHTITGRVEAMKLLLAHVPGSPETAQRFLREIKIHASLSHRNIAAVHNAFWHEGSLALVMEFVDGESLVARLARKGRLPLNEALDIVQQMLDGLAYAHIHGVVHRDISAANVLIDRAGTVKLTDFGLAKTPTDMRLTQTGAMVGSVYYCSPEQIRAKRDLDARTDIYSCGVICYELVTGKKPFRGDDAFAVMMAHTQTLPVPPVELNPELPVLVSKAILTALAKDPRDRFVSAGAFAEALRAASAGRANVAPPAPGRRRRWWLYGVLAFLAGLALFAGAVWFWTYCCSAPAEAVTPPVSATPAPSGGEPKGAAPETEVKPEPGAAKPEAKRSRPTAMPEGKPAPTPSAGESAPPSEAPPSSAPEPVVEKKTPGDGPAATSEPKRPAWPKRVWRKITRQKDKSEKDGETKR